MDDDCIDCKLLDELIQQQATEIQRLKTERDLIRSEYEWEIELKAANKKRFADRIEQRENELADFKLRLNSALDCVEELYNADCIHYTEKDSTKMKDMLCEIYNRAGMLLQIERGYGENKGFTK